MNLYTKQYWICIFERN